MIRFSSYFAARILSTLLLIGGLLPAYAVERISGVVTSVATGNPINLVDMDVFDSNGASVSITGGTSGAGGVYTLTLPGPGTYTIRADSSRAGGRMDQYYDHAFLPSLATPITVTTGQTVSGIDFDLDNGVEIQGTIRSSANNQSIAGVDLDLYGSTGEFLSGYSATSAADGSYGFGALPAGTYFLRADPDPGIGQFFVKAYYDGEFLLYHIKLADDAIPQQPVSTIFAKMPEAGGVGDVAKAGQDDVDVLMRRLLESRPTFSETAAAALRNADYSPEEITRWKRTVRTRNLLPQLVVESGSREWPSSVYTTQYYRNQFGVRIPEDIHRNDNIADLDNKSVSLRWDLGNLLFDADEVQISEEARSRAIDRNDLLKDVSRLYFSRAELLVKEYLTLDSIDEKSRISLKLELAETAEMLNQVCGTDLFDPILNPLMER